MNSIYTENSGMFLPVRIKRLAAIAMLLLLGLVISACSDSRPPEQIVQERSQARLEALLDKDISKAWTYTTPSYQKLATPGQYLAQVQGVKRWTNGAIESVSCEGDVCNVVTMITYKHEALGYENTRPIEDKWIKVDGQWWLYQH